MDIKFGITPINPDIVGIAPPPENARETDEDEIRITDDGEIRITD